MEAQEKEDKKPGRPPGTVDSPDRLLYQELIQHIKLYRRQRELIQRRIDQQGETMPAGDLTTFTDLTRRGMIEIAKAILPPAKGGPGTEPGDQIDAEKFLAEMMKEGTK